MSGRASICFALMARSQAIRGRGLAPSGAPPAAIERPDFEIVPRKGLILVAVVLILLIAAIATNELWPLAFFHFVGGASWTIIDLFLGFVLGPIMGKLSVPARVEFTTRLMPKMVLIMPTVVTATLAAGWQLGVHLGTVDSSYYRTTAGRSPATSSSGSWPCSRSACSSRRTSRSWSS